MNQRRYLLRSVLCSLAVLLLGSCSTLIYDDLSQCRGGYLAFSYHADDDASVEHLPEYIHQINLFIYNDQNALVEQHTLTQEDLDRFQAPVKAGVQLQLTPG